MQSKVRVIARLDVKGPNVVKGIRLEGLRVVGQPRDLARKYYEQGADEIFYMDIVASLYQRNNLTEIVAEAAKEIFIPLTVGGGIRKLDDIDRLLQIGADKVAINTAGIQNPSLLSEAAKRFGSQCIVLSVEAKKISNQTWECFTDNGRETTGRNVVEWCRQAINLGVGEILLTSVDCEGTQKGFDLKLISEITAFASIPVVVCGGAGNVDHVANCIQKTNADAVALASLLHYDKTSVLAVKEALSKQGVGVRLGYGKT